ncbi:MAG: Gfo/Idh/MocA family protein [Galactobacter sp.]
MSNIRLGVIGLGSMGRHHVRLARADQGAELVAVADPVGDRFGVAGELPVLNSVEQLIGAGIDAAIVAVPTVYHKDVALALAAAGVHTMVEKPVAGTVEDGELLASTFEEAQLVGAVGYVERCNASIIELRKRIREGQLGQIFQITTIRQSPFPARITDVGVVKDLATHDIDMTAWLAGADYESISAEVSHKAGREFEDMVVASGKMTNGIIVNHTVNWLAPFKERRTTVIGEKGAFVADTATGDLTYFANASVTTEWDEMAAFRGPSEGDVTRYAFPKREPLAVEHENFLAAINGDSSRIVTMREGVKTLQVIDRILSSANHSS